MRSAYLAALGTLAALHRRVTEGGSYHVRVALARTGMWYMAQDRVAEDAQLPGPMTREAAEAWTIQTHTAWGQMAHLAPVVAMSRTAHHWVLPSPMTGVDAPAWVLDNG
ncbi:MAG: hypothetical protein GKR90_10485 [Pseudomonadales bacterium]|nr:hypothetical protein [Pseudomonadales bacterium]